MSLLVPLKSHPSQGCPHSQGELCQWEIHMSLTPTYSKKGPRWLAKEGAVHLTLSFSLILSTSDGTWPLKSKSDLCVVTRMKWECRSHADPQVQPRSSSVAVLSDCSS